MHWKLFIIGLICMIYENDADENKTQTSYDFKLFTLNNELLVTFNGFYTKSVRRQHIISALRNINEFKFGIKPHLNDLKTILSDFDVVSFDSQNLTQVQKVKNTLTRYSAIKTVTAHKKIVQSLKDTSERDAQRHPLRWTGPVGHITNVVGANELWSAGITGKGVKVAIFDTGLAAYHSHFKTNCISERTDWTSDGSLEDNVGHGTFVAGVIASSSPQCPGLAPDAKLYIYRVFTSRQISYTSWFLDAFNHAISRKIRVLNLSIGGPDFMDAPFLDKVRELTANGITMVSAIGNDGPLYGTLNNPADMPDVIGVGGVDENRKVAKFSSRGMTTWELPNGYGRVKPDVVTLGSNVRSSSLGRGCRTLSGTSVASPVVAGVVALLLSVAPQSSPIAIKQVLMETAKRTLGANIFEQGAGQVDAVQAAALLQNYKPRVTLHPPYIDLTECPYMWPYCTQPLFVGASPVIVNVTVLSGLSVTSYINSTPIWHPYTPHNGNMLEVSISYSSVLWPWSGYLVISLYASEHAVNFEGIAHGHVEVTIWREDYKSNSNITLPVRVKIIRPPPRNRRIIWSQWHQVRYPSAYVPRDDLKMKNDPLDWNADHLHTNFRDFYQQLRSAGYYIDVLTTPLNCLDAYQYGTLLLVDIEEEFWSEEVIKLRDDVVNKGLSVLIIADWYNTTVMKKVKFFDENTQQWWLPVTGGSNIPALNDLLKPFGISLSDKVLEGKFSVAGHEMYYASGTTISSFPANGRLLSVSLNDQGHDVIIGSQKVEKLLPLPISGILEAEKSTGGRIAIYGDSNCVDSSHMQIDCFWFILSLLDYTNSGVISSPLSEHFEKRDLIKRGRDPERMEGSRLREFTKTNRTILDCPRIHFASPRSLNITINEGSFRRMKLFSLPLKIKTFPKNPAVEQDTVTSMPTTVLILAFLCSISVVLFFIRFWYGRKFRRRSHRVKEANRIYFSNRVGFSA
ncbi:DgyrCDS2379 [Dimorphilus gyrociliatus]|uniref:DgyrCDS2379 n=1 Tax=Dimorphilus gyrociliatus TaxID=2664684 RepID=A0A7I8VAC8_9ANNE|nr:DgyrCDS2379 [Dimorphilus gyrociliatus]